MGDSGAMLLGFLLAGISVQGLLKTAVDRRPVLPAARARRADPRHVVRAREAAQVPAAALPRRPHAPAPPLPQHRLLAAARGRLPLRLVRDARRAPRSGRASSSRTRTASGTRGELPRAAAIAPARDRRVGLHRLPARDREAREPARPPPRGGRARAPLRLTHRAFHHSECELTQVGVGLPANDSTRPPPSGPLGQRRTPYGLASPATGARRAVARAVGGSGRRRHASQARSEPLRSTTTFAPPVYVDQQLAGGEPTVFADTLHGRLIYTSHEGTTHLYRDGITSSPWGDFSFVSNYCNQVNIWTSTDGGVNWIRDHYLDTHLPGEPDLHGLQRSRPDPGRRRPRLQHRHQPRQRRAVLVERRRRHLGQGHRAVPRRRPAVARRRPGEPGLPRHRHARGQRQRPPGLRLERRRQELQPQRDPGQRLARRRRLAGAAFGKLYYDRKTLGVVEPAIFNHGDGSFGVGISTMPFGGSSFTPHEGYRGTSMYAHWPAIAIDEAGTVYVVWDTNTRQAGTSGGCSGAETPAPNQILMISTKDLGKTWTKPYAVAHPSNARVFWPWIAAGDAGKVSVVWYQTEPQDGMPDLDCQTGHVHAMEASLTGATTAKPAGTTVDAAGRADPRRLGLPGRHDLRRDRPGPAARRLLHERDRRARLRPDRDRRHAADGPAHGRAVPDRAPAVPAPERRPGPRRQGHLLLGYERAEARARAVCASARSTNSPARG